MIHIIACFRNTGMCSRLSVSILFANTKQVTCTKNTWIDNLNWWVSLSPIQIIYMFMFLSLYSDFLIQNMWTEYKYLFIRRQLQRLSNKLLQCFHLIVFSWEKAIILSETLPLSCVFHFVSDDLKHYVQSSY